jgi:hypothetical protein
VADCRAFAAILEKQGVTDCAELLGYVGARLRHEELGKRVDLNALPARSARHRSNCPILECRVARDQVSIRGWQWRLSAHNNELGRTPTHNAVRHVLHERRLAVLQARCDSRKQRIAISESRPG